MRIIVSILCLIHTWCHAQTLDVMSYNIRYATDYDGVNSWEDRREDMVKQLAYYAPDVMGMQEVLLEQKSYLEKELSHYRSIGVARDDGESKGEFSPIFYQPQKLDLLDSGTFWLSTTPEVPSKDWDAALPRICSVV